LIGIVKKNAIMMIDFALEAEREQGLPPREAILPGLFAAVSAHPHDDAGGVARCVAVDVGWGCGQRVAASAGA
jgi:hypothetical protein